MVRTLEYCPHCGNECSLSTRPGFSRERAHRTIDGKGKVETWERWERYHCAECDNSFGVPTRIVRRYYDKTGTEYEDKREALKIGGDA